MNPTRFMRVPFFVTGYKVTPDNMEQIARWCDGYVVKSGETPFIRVPVDRPTNKKQTEAYPGMWVLLSVKRGRKSYKVYYEEVLQKNFFEVPEGSIEVDALYEGKLAS